MQILLSVALYNALFSFLPCTTLASVILIKQNFWSNYSSCAQNCFEPSVQALDCTWTSTEALNSCVCSSVTFLNGFMTCTYQYCGNDELVAAAGTTVGNCYGTNTPTVLTEAQLVSTGQGISSPSSAADIFPTSTGKSPAITPYIIYREVI